MRVSELIDTRLAARERKPVVDFDHQDETPDSKQHFILARDAANTEKAPGVAS